MAWYRLHARKLPWRGVGDPYATWVSEVMLQQTRVAAVIEHYHRFLNRFPTLGALAAAPEDDVLAAWSGLGYYRRARMMQRAAKAVANQLEGVIPSTSTDLRLLPGIGEYTCAAIASIAFGESIAALDGNVERVLLRLTGRSEEATAAGKAFLRDLAAQLVPPANPKKGNLPGDHNQAMMELGATICLPRGPLCLNCPVYALCETRGEHKTAPRAKARARPIAYLLHLCNGTVLLERRSADASMMAGMYQLPVLPLDTVEGRSPLLRLRHSITNTVYMVSVYTSEGNSLLNDVPARAEDLHLVNLTKVQEIPLTGLARKVIRRMELML